MKPKTSCSARRAAPTPPSEPETRLHAIINAISSSRAPLRRVLRAECTPAAQSQLAAALTLGCEGPAARCARCIRRKQACHALCLEPPARRCAELSPQAPRHGPFSDCLSDRHPPCPPRPHKMDPTQCKPPPMPAWCGAQTSAKAADEAVRFLHLLALAGAPSPRGDACAVSCCCR